VDTETEEEERKEAEVSQNDTTSVNIIVRVSTVPENASSFLRVAVVLKYTKIQVRVRC
jgi:hypothetical protein